MSRQLAELLLKEKIITQTQFNDAATAAKAQGSKGFVRYLIEQKVVSETKLLYFLSQKFGIPSINLAKFEISPEVVKIIPTEMVKKAQAIPIQAAKGTLVVAICDPSYLGFMEELKFKSKMNIEAVLTSYSAFDAAMQRYFGGAATVGQAIESFKKETKKEQKGAGEVNIELVEVHDIEGVSEQDAPVIQLVNGLLMEGIRKNASDIHVEPYEKRVRVRMRIDGVLVEIAEIPPEMKRAVIARMKIMSRMDIAESRLPQDGRIKLRMGGQEIDFRASTMPTLFGEKVVLRMLSKGNLQLDLLKLGFEQEQLETFKKGIHSPTGMVLVTGPTGSGKTTTLYSALIELNQLTDNLTTVEDPVEYNFEGINQVQVHKEIGLTFASALRTFLRQDPDIILVGEIRDYETAEVAVQAALTGHLVLSTLHTNDAPSTITRLVNMGVEPFLVVASLNTIVAQRLIRTICPKCKTEQNVPRERLIEVGIPPEMASQMKCYHGTGCPNCNKTGYKGRLAIYEVLDFAPNLKEMVLRGESVIELKNEAIRAGMKPLRMSALTKVAEGRTTLAEALSLTMEK